MASAFENFQRIFGLGQYSPEGMAKQQQQIQQKLQGMLGMQQTTQPQVGAMLPGQERPDITAMQEGTEILPEAEASKVARLMANPLTKDSGQKLLEQLLERTVGKPALKPGEIATLTGQAKPIREEGRNLRTNFDAMKSSFEASEGKGRAAADLAMVISFAKMLDPTSVVRSEEGETIQKTGGFFGMLRGMEEQIKGSGSLDANARTGLMLEAGRQFQARFGALQPSIEFHKQKATDSGIKPSQLLSRDLLNPDKKLADVSSFLVGLKGALNAPNIPPPNRRQKGGIYQTPKGRLKWTGTGWVKP